MKIGVSTLASQGENLEDFLIFVEDLNVDYVEILNEYPNHEVDRELLDSYSMKYTIHSPIADLNLGALNKSINKASINEIKRSITIANEINSNLVVIHPGRVSFTGRFFEDKIKAISEESMKICGRFGEDLGVTVAVENMPKMEGFLYQDPAELNEFLENNSMAMTLDIGHMHTYNPKIDSYFKTVKHIHLSDNNGDFDHHYPLGEGTINFKDIIMKYEKNNYMNVYVIEVNDKESVIKSLDYLNNLNNI